VIRTFWAAVILVLGQLLAAGAASAHEVRPGLLQLTEIEADTFAMLWRVPARGDRVLALSPVLPSSCIPRGPPERRRDSTRLEERRTVTCPGGLAGRQVVIDGLTRLRTDVLVRITYISGATETLRASPQAPVVRLAGTPSLAQVAASYVGLGVEHIVLGVDHVLFVLALLLLVSGWRRLVGAVTAFTVAHSITLAAATLGFVAAPPALIECLIALSIVVVAAEVVGRTRGKTSIAIRRPWLIAFGFGLLHGFGFAGALSAIGLPATAVPSALLFFNIGVEIGQLMIIAAALVTTRILAMIGPWPVHRLRYAAAGSIGVIAGFWAVERAVAIWI